MKLQFVALVTSICLLSVAYAEDYQPNPLERAPNADVKCDWSKLNFNEYRECQKRKEYYENQTGKERVKQNLTATRNRMIAGALNIENGGGVGLQGAVKGKHRPGR